MRGCVREEDSMAGNNIDTMSYTELVKFHEKLQQAIAEKRILEAAMAKEQLRAAAVKAGFTIEDLFGRRGAHKLAAVKYCNPKDPSQTWIGRGRRPNSATSRRNASSWCAVNARLGRNPRLSPSAAT